MATFLICSFIFVVIVLPDWIMNAIERHNMKKIDKEWRKKHGEDHDHA